ncbi:MAG: AMP-binding protein [Woeseiaceae bacterium]
MTRISHIESRQHVPEDYPRFESLVHMLKVAVDEGADTTAIVCGDQSIDYRDMGAAVAGLATKLQATGSADSRVIILIPSSIETVVAVFAAMAAHAQAAPLNPYYTEREISTALKDIDASTVLCVESTRDLAQSVALARGAANVINLDSEGWTLKDLVSLAPDGLQADHLPTADEPALMLMTGGTTGVPKGVNHRHRGLVWSTLLHCAVWPVNVGKEVLLNVAPLFHIWGLGFGVLVTIFSRGTFVLVPRYDPDDVLNAISDQHVTIFGGGPAPIYAGLLGSDTARQTDFSSLHYCLSGGAPCPEDLHHRWLETTGCPIFEGWGMSEGAPFCVNPASGMRKLLSVGPPVPETTVEIVDLESGDTVLPLGESGEVRVKGPQVMDGYCNNPEETALALRDGWLHTGDIGYFDDDGYLHLVDRKKDMVIVGGYNVYPREIDELLCLHPAIREATAVSRPDARLGEVLVAFVVLQRGESLSEEECLEYCRTNLVKYKRPVAIHFIDALPRTAANKIDKVALRKSAAELGAQT